MNWVAIFALLAFAMSYPWLVKMGPSTRRWVSNLLVLNAFAVGAAGTWLIACLLRALWLIPKGVDWHFADILLSPGILFSVESWVILGALGLESRFLRGAYNATDEWKSTAVDGAKFTAFYVFVAFSIFIASWWLMAPGSTGRFEGSIADPIVTTQAVEIYSSSSLELSQALEEMGVTENNEVIPHAIALAGIIALIAYTYRPVANYFQQVLNDDYFHPEDVQGSGNNNPFPPARGGGPN